MTQNDTQLDPQQYPDKDVYGVIGNPVAHSLSPLIHHQFAQQAHQNILYGKLFSDVEQFEKTVDTFFSRGGKGLNITVPFKLRAFNVCARLTDRAKAAGVVNILWQENGQYVGDNSDGLGLVRDIKNSQFIINKKNILLIGAGGAVQGVVLPFLNEQPHSIVIANRTLEKAQKIVERFKAQAKQVNTSLRAISLHHLEQEKEPFDIIINGTSTGLDQVSPLTDSQVKSLTNIPAQALAYDMVYGKTTVFMQQMQEQGLNVKDGLGMLVEQAAVAFEVWRGGNSRFELNTKIVLASLSQKVNT
jgi:shikimate dehydrogenase